MLLGLYVNVCMATCSFLWKARLLQAAISDDEYRVTVTIFICLGLNHFAGNPQIAWALLMQSAENFYSVPFRYGLRSLLSCVRDTCCMCEIAVRYGVSQTCYVLGLSSSALL